MPRQLLNVFMDQAGVSPPNGLVEARAAAQINGRRVRLWESNRSGTVILEGAERHAYGDPEVYLQINFAGGGFQYLSAPLMTQIDFDNVGSIDLAVLFPTGPAGTPYRALVNGHCIYEIL